jgi:hypothetical protein
VVKIDKIDKYGAVLTPLSPRERGSKKEFPSPSGEGVGVRTSQPVIASEAKQSREVA